MPGRNREAQLASDALFLARGDPFDVDAGGLQTVCEYFEVAVAANLEADPIKTGHIRLAQDDAVSIEFVEPAEKCPVTRTTDEFQPDPVAIMGDGLLEIEDAHLDKAWSHHACNCHHRSPGKFKILGRD